MRAKLALVVGFTLAGVAGSVAVTGSASAAPSHAKNLFAGTATCTNGATYSFVTNGNSGQGTSWSPAFLTAADGSRALFLPSTLDLLFTAPDGTFPVQESKHSGPGPVSCTIIGHPAGFPEATGAGTVTGTIVTLGR